MDRRAVFLLLVALCGCSEPKQPPLVPTYNELNYVTQDEIAFLPEAIEAISGEFARLNAKCNELEAELATQKRAAKQQREQIAALRIMFASAMRPIGGIMANQAKLLVRVVKLENELAECCKEPEPEPIWEPIITPTPINPVVGPEIEPEPKPAPEKPTVPCRRRLLRRWR